MEELAPPRSSSLSYRSVKLWHSALVLFAVIAPVALVVWTGRGWFLRAAADQWIILDPLGPADAVMRLQSLAVESQFARLQPRNTIAKGS